jgi:hypothetical protein
MWLALLALSGVEVALTLGRAQDLVRGLLYWTADRLAEWGLDVVPQTWPIAQLVLPTGDALFLAGLITLLGAGGIGAAALASRWVRGASAGSAFDPAIRLRDFFRRHRRLGVVLSCVPALLPALLLHRSPLALGLAGALNFAFNRILLRTLDGARDRAAAPVPAVDDDETRFQAVAVTARTWGAVGFLIALTAYTLYGAARGQPAIFCVVAPLAFVAWFRQASTIAVGRDGVFIRGTSKKRFFPYRSFDQVRLHGVQIDLLRGGKRVLALQLHGADAARASSLVERIQAGLAAAGRTDGAHLLARVANGAALGRAARGATDYREAAISREQLWELVEGEATEGEARLAAAGALATTGDPQDRARLRVAAVHVADPRVRIALEELGDESADDRDAAIAPRALVKDGAFT